LEINDNKEDAFNTELVEAVFLSLLAPKAELHFMPMFALVFKLALATILEDSDIDSVAI
jgi:hypothetical protein